MANPKKPRTEAQKRADFYKTFQKKVNARRLELIQKQFDTCPQRKRGWKFDEHPGWREEFDALLHAALTPEEHAELAECERVLNEWEKPLMKERFEMLEEFEAYVERMKLKIAAEKEREKLPWN